jgi:hypothetical protein
MPNNKVRAMYYIMKIHNVKKKFACQLDNNRGPICIEANDFFAHLVSKQVSMVHQSRKDHVIEVISPITINNSKHLQ